MELLFAPITFIWVTFIGSEKTSWIADKARQWANDYSFITPTAKRRPKPPTDRNPFITTTIIIIIKAIYIAQDR